MDPISACIRVPGIRQPRLALWPFLLFLCASVRLFGQPSPTKEFVRFGDRVIAIENPAGGGGQVAAPVFDVAGGTYQMAKYVNITTTTFGATIRYTTDGTTPSQSNGTIYTSGSPVLILNTSTLKAIAYATGMTDSTITSASYTINAPGAGIYDDRDALMVYNTAWTQNTNTGNYLGTQSYSNGTSNSVSFTFNGTSISYVYAMASNIGYANIYIDGSLVQSNLDGYMAYTGWCCAFGKLWTSPTLSAGNHIIKVVVTGQKNPSSTDAYLTLDAFIVGTSRNDTDVSVSYSGTWTYATDSRLWSGDEHYSNTNGDYVQYTFTGTFVTVSYAAIWNMGIANVTIDGVSQGSFDAYSSDWAWQSSRSFGGLSAGSHTIRITVSGTKNASSTDYYFAPDRFISQ